MPGRGPPDPTIYHRFAMRTPTDLHLDVRPSAAAMLGPVREDMRQTLRVAWIDPSFEAVAAHPVFFTTAWSAIRPNVGKSFILLSRALRSVAAESLRSTFEVRDLRKAVEPALSEEELRRVVEAARAAHVSAAKVQIVVHALYRAVRRERIAGTGLEEPTVRRGIPEWQRWMSIQQSAEESLPLLERAGRRLNAPAPPAALRLFARWPAALRDLWGELSPILDDDLWRVTAARLRRTVHAGVSSLPHPIELQWPALGERGFSERDRLDLMDTLAAHDRAASAHTLTAAFAWLSFGAPEIGAET